MSARSGVEGVEELARLLRRMSRSEDAVTAFRAGTLKAARLVRRRAAALLKAGAEDTGNLRKALLAQAPRRSRKYAAVAFVSVRSRRVPDYRRKSGTGNPANYAHLVEFGMPGRGVPGSPFLRPAVEQTAQESGDLILATAAEHLEKLARQEGRRSIRRRGGGRSGRRGGR